MSTILMIFLYYLYLSQVFVYGRSFNKPEEIYNEVEETYSFVSYEESVPIPSEQESSESDNEPGELTAADIREAQNTDVGNFTTNSYHYYNFQGQNMTPDKSDECSDAFLKCLQSIHNNPPMICGMHHLTAFKGFYDFYNFCELMIWNCMKGSREYRAVSPGHCYFLYDWYWGPAWYTLGFSIWQTYWHFELYAPGDPLGGNYVDNDWYNLKKKKK